MAGRKKDEDRLPIMMIRTRNGLSPAAPFDAERLDKYGIGATVEVRVAQRRSNEHHRLYWAVLQRVVEQADEWPKVEHLHEALKLHLGYSHPFKMITGEMTWRADSTAFSAMDQAEWKVFFDRAMQAIAQHILPGVDPVALVKEAERGLGGRAAA